MSSRYPGTAGLLRAFAAASIIALTACAGQSIVPVSGITQSGSAGADIGGLSSGDFLGCPYPSGDVYQTNISAANPDPNSAAYIQAMVDGGGDGGFQVWPSLMQLNEATLMTPLVAVHPGNSYDMPSVSTFPWMGSFFIQKDGDHHSLVLDTQTCSYYEGYKTTYYPSGDYLTMYNNTQVSLIAPFVQPSTGGLSTATGIPLGMLAVRPEELNAGIIRHALGWNAVSFSLNGAAGAPCVNPAGKVRCTDGNVYDGPPGDTPMPYGSHARLQASFDISKFPREARIIAQAMQTYGMYIYDTGCCNEIIVENDQYGQPAWTTQDQQALATITPANLDIVPPPLDGQRPRQGHKQRRS